MSSTSQALAQRLRNATKAAASSRSVSGRGFYLVFEIPMFFGNMFTHLGFVSVLVGVSPGNFLRCNVIKEPGLKDFKGLSWYIFVKNLSVHCGSANLAFR